MVHPLALALALFGEPEEIDRAVSADGGVDVRASLLLRHRGGAVSQLSASLTTLMSNAARLAMTGGSIRVEDPLIAAETVTVRRVAPPEAAPERQVTAPSPGAAAREQLASRLRRSGVARRVGRAVTAPPAETRSYGATPFLPLVSHFATLVTERRSESEILPPALSLTLSRLIAEAMEPDAALVADSTEAAV
jgi:predicted dehydrogenase